MGEMYRTKISRKIIKQKQTSVFFIFFSSSATNSNLERTEKKTRMTTLINSKVYNSCINHVSPTTVNIK